MIELLLDAAPGREDLRLLSAQACTASVKDGEYTTKLTRIGADNGPAILVAVDSVLNFCDREAGLVADLWSDWGYCAADIADAVKSTCPGIDLNSHAKWGDDGDSPHFVATLLKSLSSGVKDAVSSEQVLVYWTWGRSD